MRGRLFALKERRALLFKTFTLPSQLNIDLVMLADFYALSDVLKVASVHPFYSDAEYAPTREQIPSILQTDAGNEDSIQLASFPIAKKDSLYATSIPIAIEPR